MIVKSPLKQKKARPNLPKDPVRDKRKGGKRVGKRSPKEVSHGRRINKDKKKKRVSLPELQPWKVILGVFVLGALGVLYLNHVFATRELLREVQRLEHEYNQTRRVNADYRLMYDRLTGPAEIYEKAKGLGLVNGGPAEKVIEVEKE